MDLSGTSGQNFDEIARALAKLVSLAMAHGAPIAHEEFDCARKRGDLRYMPRILARLRSSIAYAKFAATVASRCAHERAKRIPVDSAYSSVLRQANCAGVYRVSVAHGGVCVIAGRALLAVVDWSGDRWLVRFRGANLVGTAQPFHLAQASGATSPKGRS